MLKRWKKEDWVRVKDTVRVFSGVGLHYFVDKAKLHYHVPFMKAKAPKEDIAKRIRNALEKLGGPYVKLGQLLSLRPDLVPSDWCEEFSGLQDNVNPFSYDIARKEIDKAAGGDFKKIFWKIEKKPIGSASISQVHEAVLKDGTEVVVKVLRPDIKKIYDADIDVMRFLSRKMEKHMRLGRYSPVRIVEEFERYSQEELDLRVEARRIAEFHKSLRQNTSLIVPKVYPGISNENILVMTQLKGSKLSDLIRSGKKFNKKSVALHLFDLGIRQTFLSEIFHADLHPGNIIITKEGKIGILDFGITGSLNPEMREQGIRLYIALIEDEPDEVFRALESIGLKNENYFPDAIRNDIQWILQLWHGRENMRISSVLHLLLDSCLKNGLLLPDNLILLAKSLVTIEGTCNELFPDFNVVKESRPYIVELMRGEMNSDINIKRLLKESYHVKEFIKGMPRKIEKALDIMGNSKLNIDVDATDINRLGSIISASSARVSFGLIIAALILSGAILLQVNIPPLIGGYSVIALVCILIGITLALIAAL